MKVAREYERGVVFRLGRLIGIKGPGLFILIPFIDKAVKVDLRTITLNVPPQEVITKDNVTVKVNAVAYFRVVDPSKAIVQVENYLVATSQIAQTTLRSVLGQVDLDQLLSERDQINERLQAIIDEQTHPWGVKVSVVEVKDVELPTRACSGRSPARPRPSASGARRSSPPRASSRPPRSSARRRAVISAEPGALQLRYLQTMNEIGTSEQHHDPDPAVPGRDARGPSSRSPRADGRGRNGRRRRREQLMRAIWNGFVSFGLVTIPVAWASRSSAATSASAPSPGRPCSRSSRSAGTPSNDVEVGPDDTVQGCEVSKGRYLAVEDDELERFAARRRRRSRSCSSSRSAEVDPVYFERAYWLEPQERAERPYPCWRRRWRSRGRAALGRFVLSTKEHLVLLRAVDGMLTLRRSTTPRTCA